MTIPCFKASPFISTGVVQLSVLIEAWKASLNSLDASSRPLFKRFRKIFPIPSCWDVSSIFHKLLWEKLQSLDWKTHTKQTTSLAIKILPALAFEKIEEIGNSYDKIVEEIQINCDRTIKESEKNSKRWRALPLFWIELQKCRVPNRAVFSPLHYGIKRMRHHRVWPEQQML